MNSVDSVSRGIRPCDLAQHHLYWKVLSFLHQVWEAWSSKVPLIPSDQLTEVTGFASCVVESTGELDEWFSRSSSLNHMLRVIIRLQRYIKMCRKEPVNKTSFSLREYNKVLLAVVRCSQFSFLKSLYQELSSNKKLSSRTLARLTLFIDEHGVIRVGGRLRHSLLSDRRKHPILLSKLSQVSRLVA